MSSNRRPWFPWYPKDFVVDEKVQGLSDDAELLYRRVLDVLWQANALQLPNNCLKLANQIARGWSKERFENAWNEIQTPGFELLKTSEDGKMVYSKRLLAEAQKIENISKKRSENAKKAKGKQKQSKSKASAKQKHSHTDPDTDNNDLLDKSKRSTPAPSGQPSADFLPSKKPGHWSDHVGKWFENILENGKLLQGLATESKMQFNPWQMIQLLVNEKYHPGAVMEITDKLVKMWPNINGTPYQYINAFKKTVKQNWNEKEAIEIHNKLKAMAPGELSELTHGIFNRL